MTPEEISERIPAFRSDLYQMARNRVRADVAEEIVQDTVMILLDKAGRLRPDELKPYAIGIVRNQALSQRRRMNDRPKQSVDDVEPETCPAMLMEAAQEHIFDAVRAMAVIDTLAEPYRRVALDVLVEGRSQEEAAERAGIPVGSVKSKVNRLREQLQHTLTTGRPLPPTWQRGQSGPRDDLDQEPDPQPMPKMA